ncbi:MAG: TIGR04283 family arsenosugar biosynthesis glycosyltransferase [Azoarcus sp.]|nr:TIGR04283 family arsenosugar biosynthesis glycosyltransferase [Azoarcus sp.]
MPSSLGMDDVGDGVCGEPRDAGPQPWISVIVPVLNEGSGLATCLSRLTCLRDNGAELIVADGGSEDGTAELARTLADRVLTAPRGRASQMNAGAAVARADVLLFVHADTQLPPQALAHIRTALGGSVNWGRFDVDIDGHAPLLRSVAALMNLRSRLTGIATGDQAIFVRRAVFEAVGTYPDIALMEDVALSTALRKLGRPACIRARVITSGRRWDKHGVLRTIVLMWWLRAAYFLGADPDDLALRYGYRPRSRNP